MKDTDHPNHHLYSARRYRYGWILCGNGGVRRGIPMDALNECLPLFKKGSLIDNGICHHYREWCDVPAVIAVGTPSDLTKWRAEIEKALDEAKLPPQQRWWNGLDTGASSEAMFLALTSKTTPILRHTPLDSDDLGRCLRLLKAVPDFAPRLSEVAAAYPDTAWPAIIARWSELEAATPEEQTKILHAIHEKH
jgi:hypothetical protein